MSINIRLLKELPLRDDSWYDRIRSLILDGFFKSIPTSAAVSEALHNRHGDLLPVVTVQKYMKKFMPKFIRAYRQDGAQRLFWYQADLRLDLVRQQITKRRTTDMKSSHVFPASLRKELGRNFKVELNDFDVVYGNSGTCTAFILRKILEKLIFLVFAKLQQGDVLKDSYGNFKGLSEFLESASTQKVKSKPILMPKTKRYILGIKFLADNSAHNPLINIEMDDIVPHLAFIFVAYKELASHL